jgi:hypothetical protein
VFVGSANEKLKRKIRIVLRKNRARGPAENLIVKVGFMLSDVATNKNKQVMAAAKLYSELREGPLKEWKKKANYYEKAEAFLRSKEGVDWSK